MRGFIMAQMDDSPPRRRAGAETNDSSQRPLCALRASAMSYVSQERSFFLQSLTSTIIVFLFLSGTLTYSQTARPRATPIYEDVYFAEQGGRIVFGNAQLRLDFDAASGDWLLLGAAELPGSMIASMAPSKAIDFRVDGAWIIERHGATLIKRELSIDKTRKAVTLRLIYGVLSAAASSQTETARRPYEYELTAAYSLFPGESRVERTARLARNDRGASHSGTARRMEGFLFQLPGAAVAEPKDCVVDVPGPFFPKSFVAPETPYLSLAGRRIRFHSAPDAGFGLLAVTNKRHNRSLGSWMETAGEVAYLSSLHGGDRLTLAHQDMRAYFLSVNFAVDSDVHHVELASGGLPSLLASYRRMVERTMPPAPTPDWVREMVILEAFPSTTRAGSKGLTKTRFYKKIGFTAIYVMPHWMGGYSPIDLYRGAINRDRGRFEGTGAQSARARCACCWTW
ncbi:MAG: hypothetical protein WKF30_06665 [Pyrinomonadaceae bacterium]